MKTLENQISEITSIVKSFGRVAKRVEALEALGYTVEKHAMGSGGVLQQNETKHEIRVQIGYGVTRHNYAMVVCIAK